jgi:hypothetical protein
MYTVVLLHDKRYYVRVAVLINKLNYFSIYRFKNVENMYCLEYTDIPKAYFTPHYIDRVA